MLLVRLRVLPITRMMPIASGYRPDWVSDLKPEYNCARLTFPGDPIPPGGTFYGALLEPLQDNLWSEVKVGDILEAREGRKTTATALVTHMIRDDCEHEASAMRLHALWGAAEDSPEYVEMTALARLIEAYEDHRRWRTDHG